MDGRTFLSTPSVRRATALPGDVLWAIDISIHALREEGDFYAMLYTGLYFGISIHALREEGDIFSVCRNLFYRHFYPRPP